MQIGMSVRITKGDYTGSYGVIERIDGNRAEVKLSTGLVLDVLLAALQAQ